MILRSLFPVVVALLVLTGCVAPPRKPLTIKRAVSISPGKRVNYWKGDGVKGEPRIVIVLPEQRAYFYLGEQLVGESSVSTGKKGFETPAGEYQVTQKDKDHVSTLYGQFVDEGGAIVQSNVDMAKDRPPAGAVFRGAKMPYFVRFHEAYGLHAGRVPAYRASHGCVRLPRAFAVHFYQNSEVGTPVVLQD